MIVWQIYTGTMVSRTNFGVKVKDLRFSQNEDYMLILLQTNELICYKNFSNKYNFKILNGEENNNSTLLLIDNIESNADRKCENEEVKFHLINLNSHKFYQLVFNSSSKTPIVKTYEIIDKRIENETLKNSILIVTEKLELLFIHKHFERIKIYRMSNEYNEIVDKIFIDYERKEDEKLLKEYFKSNKNKELKYYLLNCSPSVYFIQICDSSDSSQVSSTVIKIKLLRSEKEFIFLVENIFFNVSNVCTQPDAICICINENSNTPTAVENFIYVKNYKSSSEHKLTIEQNLKILLIAIDSNVEYLAYNDVSKVISLYRIYDGKKVANVPIYDFGVHMKFSMDNKYLCLATCDKRIFSVIVIDSENSKHANRLLELVRYKQGNATTNANISKSQYNRIVDDFTESSDDEEKFENEEKVFFNKTSEFNADRMISQSESMSIKYNLNFLTN